MGSLRNQLEELRHVDKAIQNVKEAIVSSLNTLKKEDLDVVMQKRFEKFRQMGNMTLTLDQSDSEEAKG